MIKYAIFNPLIQESEKRIYSYNVNKYEDIV